LVVGLAFGLAGRQTKSNPTSLLLKARNQFQPTAPTYNQFGRTASTPGFGRGGFPSGPEILGGPGFSGYGGMYGPSGPQGPAVLDGRVSTKSAISIWSSPSYRSKECRWDPWTATCYEATRKDDKPVEKIPMSSLMNRSWETGRTDAKAPLPPVESKPDLQLLGTPSTTSAPNMTKSSRHSAVPNLGHSAAGALPRHQL